MNIDSSEGWNDIQVVPKRNNNTIVYVEGKINFNLVMVINSWLFHESIGVHLI